MPIARRRGIRLSLALGALAGTLVGCSALGGGADAGSQRIADACASVSARVDAAMAAFAEVDASDPAGTGAALADVVESLREAGEAIDNAELEAVVTDLHGGFAKLSDAVRAAAGGDVTAVAGLASATEAIRGAGSDFQRLCAG